MNYLGESCQIRRSDNDIRVPIFINHKLRHLTVLNWNILLVVSMRLLRENREEISLLKYHSQSLVNFANWVVFVNNTAAHLFQNITINDAYSELIQFEQSWIGDWISLIINFLEVFRMEWLLWKSFLMENIQVRWHKHNLSLISDTFSNLFYHVLKDLFMGHKYFLTIVVIINAAVTNISIVDINKGTHHNHKMGSISLNSFQEIIQA